MTRILAILILSLGLAVPAAAQSRERGPDQVPKGHRPPPGMCRIWIDGVPANQQPAPTDCKTAIRNRPPNGRVIFGDDYAKQNRGTKSNVPDLLKEFRRIKEKQADDKEDDKASDKRKRYRKP
jgi:hypothetical protein